METENGGVKCWRRTCVFNCL